MSSNESHENKGVKTFEDGSLYQEVPFFEYDKSKGEWVMDPSL